MVMDPLCEGTKVLAHSVPGIHWWLGLNAAEQAAWAAAVMGLLAAIGGTAAAIGSFRAAKIALVVAEQAAQREGQRFARRAEVHAAYIFNELALVYEFRKVISPLAASLADPELETEVALNALDQIDKAADQWKVLVSRVSRESVASLPDECGAATAGALSSIQFACFQIKAATKSERAKKNLGQIYITAQQIVRRCESIKENFAPYVAYARKTFQADIDDS